MSHVRRDRRHERERQNDAELKTEILAGTEADSVSDAKRLGHVISGIKYLALADKDGDMVSLIRDVCDDALAWIEGRP